MEQREFKKYLYLCLGIYLLAILGTLYYFTNSLNSFQSNINNNLTDFYETISHNLTSVKNKLSEDISSFNKSLSIMEYEVSGRISGLETNLRKEFINESSNLRSNLTTILSTIKENLDVSSQKQKEDFAKLSSDFEEAQASYTKQFDKLKIDLAGLNVDSLKISSLDFSDTIKKVLPSVVSITTNQGKASGVFVSDKELVTSYHVVATASFIQITTYNGTTYEVFVEQYNDTMDLALLKINTSTTFSNLNFAQLFTINLGSKVVAIGNPYGLGFSVTEGIVSGLNRPGPSGLDIYIQTDVPVNPGNSGGPIININGDIIGITTFKVSNSEGLGFAIGSDYVREFVQS